MTDQDMSMPTTVAELLLERSGDDSTGLYFEDQTWSWDEMVQASADRARWLESLRGEGPFHVAVLLDNIPEYALMVGAAALSGAVLVGLNSTRRGGALIRDVANTDCQILVTESRYLELLDLDELDIPADRIFVVDEPSYGQAIASHSGSARVAPELLEDTDLIMLIFTSGTSGDPKAVRMSHKKLSAAATMTRIPGMDALPMVVRPDDVVYISMPMFHSACLIAGLVPAVAAGASVVLRRRFSASGFIEDVRRYGVTYFHYVGKPLTYVLATPEMDDDLDNTLRIAFGNEGARVDLDRFRDRFGCQVVDSFGSSEGGVTMGSGPGAPPGSIGKLLSDVDILDRRTAQPVPPARFDDVGRLLNFDEAVGELVNTTGPGLFEGYYGNEKADAERMRDGMYWSGDLAYRDEDGFVYFAGRSMEWLRVDGENFGAAPVEGILARYEWAAIVAVYAVPEPQVGDQVMATLEPRSDAGAFDPDDFASFLSAQSDLGTKWTPRYVRIMDSVPTTATNKVLKRQLAREAWEASGVFVRHGDSYRPMTEEDRVALRQAFFERGNAARLPVSA